jgi:four helix bundle protein
MRQELENRLVELSLGINEVCRKLDGSFLSQHISTQIIRSSTSAALNYGEAQAAVSKKDFVHKIGIVLKVLRETKVNLKLLRNSVQRETQAIYSKCQNECDQLIAIFHKTVISAKETLS